MKCWKWDGRKRSWPNLMNFTPVFAYKEAGNPQRICQNSRFPSSEFNPGFPEYEAKCANHLVVGSLFYDAFSVTSLYMIGWIGKDLVGSCRGLILRYYPGNNLERLSKITKNLNQDSRSSGPRIEPNTSRIRSRIVNCTTTLNTWLLCSVNVWIILKVL
jgi:hypothetical protein